MHDVNRMQSTKERLSGLAGHQAPERLGRAHLLDADEARPHLQHAKQRGAVEDIEVRVRQVGADLYQMQNWCLQDAD